MNIGVAHPNGIAIRGTPIEAAGVVVAVVLKGADIDEGSDVVGTARGGKVRRWDQRQDFGGYRINATGGNVVSRKGIAGANTVADLIHHRQKAGARRRRRAAGADGISLDVVLSGSRERKIADALLSGRHVCLIKAAAANARTLIIEEEKRLVLNYRSANLPSVLVLHMLWPRAAHTVREEVIGIENFVAQIFVSQPVKGVGAALRRDGDQRPGTTAVLRGVRVGGNLEFLNCIYGRPNDLRCKFLNVFGKRVVVNAVEHEVVLQGAHSVHIHSASAPGGGAASLLSVAITLHAGNQAQQIIPVTGAKRHTSDELVFHHGTGHSVLRREQRGATFYRDRLIRRTDFQWNVEPCALADIEREFGDYGLESLSLHLKFVRAHLNHGEFVIASCTCLRRLCHIGSGVRQRDIGIRNGGAG